MSNLELQKIKFENQSDLIKSNIILHDKNWFKTGGKAKFFCEPNNSKEFKEALMFSQVNNLPIFILGEGANILISDEGFNGLVIRPNLKKIQILEYDDTHKLIKAEAGVKFQDLIDFCLNNNVIGLEEFSGIPGTAGGSVFINIHYFEFLLSQFLISAEIINKNDGKILTVNNDWFNFGYNSSTLHKHNHYLVNATFKLKPAGNHITAYSKGKSDQIIRHRQKRYPSSGTCGSFFRNFMQHELENSKFDKKLIFVAYYLDKIGVKGELSFGGAKVSHQHANMIVNEGNATTNDIIELAKEMQKLVYDKFGILPQPECRLIGFTEYPLVINNFT